MAIKKTKSLPNGTAGEYWRIVFESYDRILEIMTAQIALYKDHTCANASSSGLGVIKTFKIPMTRAESLGNRTELSYTRIKEISARMVSPISGTGTLIPYDSDLSGGEDV